ncbi:Adenine phosphoribosyltransferase 1 [Komagataella phaffii CBS 7435]|uniref:Adenine phosphoribosyltransferase n=2 Tax=Komagataella phaffii TaxID=460519 RepID=C4R373_KOMPG|nr:Adenine phosphoribosyltransferase, catalyzes the formation of AMP [Komagataella phaffii GS115]AOA63752.1 GQ67_04278T0 [Komagataella phaffii]KAI0462675.1 adenine phosphoribosyltransferase [Komagataella kurtzmanii]CAH2448946.1 Adenine phosphoribosyltransferase 1 [Komagataella phaffii CBS 7435]AOA68354.1 GQ68_04250T0 [Komagataella phaffii GS115]CAY71207.1 Adenine phosphoribosyltransferase, catalyzes the formation of AMP [Komagataella phaffii GS115]
MSTASLARELKAALKTYPDFPSEGISFEDFLPIFANHELFQKLIEAFKIHIQESFADKKIDFVVGLESRGFLFGPTLALAIGAGFVPVRKPGKLPGTIVQTCYKKEYGEDVFEMQVGAIPADSNVIVVDDILATGGSASAAGSLVKQVGGIILEFMFVMELEFLKGRNTLPAPTFTLLSGQQK